MSDGFEAVQQMLARSRLSIDACESGRTTFFSHLGAADKLVPGPWIAHRDLIYALALSNLTQNQRTALARAVLVEYERDFGVGRLVLQALDSDLPFGGSSLKIAPRGAGEHCLYTWGLGAKAKPALCHWLLLRAQPEWALDSPAKELTAHGLGTLAQLGGNTVLLVSNAVTARQVADLLGEGVVVNAHPRLMPHLPDHQPQAPILLWPHDAIGSPGLARQAPRTVVLVSAPEGVRQRCQRWVSGLAGEVELVDAIGPGRANRSRMAAFWEACGEPKVLLRGDSGWAKQGAAWLEELGATVNAQSEATQLGLF